MEVEAIEPFLYPLQGPGLGAHLAKALRGRLANKKPVSLHTT